MPVSCFIFGIACIISFIPVVRDHWKTWKAFVASKGKGTRERCRCGVDLFCLWTIPILTFIGTVVSAGEALSAEKQSEKTDPLNASIVSISAIARFRTKGDFSLVKDADPNQISGIMFMKGTNVSSGPKISLVAGLSEIKMLNVLPISEHPDEQDIIISFHEQDVVIRHFSNDWGGQNPAKLFNEVGSFVMGMPQLGTNVYIVSGSVLVTVNSSLRWEMPIPPQRQRYGTFTCQFTTNEEKKIEAKILPIHLMDFTGQRVGDFDGK
jgi:hypothetical protein